ncbi:MAG: hypothetical protein IIA33_10765, partial [Planctomycetes bacterium]|nr:hypothetical protein [Planctomycetota bacterium]
RTNEAYGVERHQPTLDWGRKHNVNRLSAHAARRVQLINGNVIRVARRKVHVVGALNFSYFTFKERNELVTYFRNVRTSLRTDGMFVLDAYGGFEAQQVMEEKTKHKGFTYVWDQAEYNPINDHTRCHIHFKFPDGTELKRAFTYDWRLWTLGAIRDALIAAASGQPSRYAINELVCLSQDEARRICEKIGLNWRTGEMDPADPVE